MIKSHDIPCDLVTWHYHMTWSHDLPHDLVTWYTTWPGHMIYHITWSIYNHMMHLLFVISRTTSKMIDVYGINTCVWYLCYFFHAFFCCFFACSINVCIFSCFHFFYCSGCIQRQFSSQTRAFTTTLLYGLLLTMCNGGPHQQVNDHATLRNYSQKADYSL